MSIDIYSESFDLTKLVKGEWQDVITKYDEHGSTEIITPIRPNIITVGISQYVSGLIKGFYDGNFAFWAVGTGSQSSSPNITQLVAEYSRKQATVNFVDNTNTITITPTSRIIMAAAWAKGELGTVTLTEFGIFAGTGANAANGGLEIDYVPHGPITLDSTISISRKIYFSF